MSSSPTICASPNFVFPPPTKTSPSKEDNFDYFSISRNAIHRLHTSKSSSVVPQSSGPSSHGVIPGGPVPSALGSAMPAPATASRHSKMNDSISSINSDQTLVNPLVEIRKFTSPKKRNDSIVSTDTLLDDACSSKSNAKNYMNLSLAVPNKFHQPSFSAGAPQSLGESHHDQRKVSSATEGNFFASRPSAPVSQAETFSPPSTGPPPLRKGSITSDAVTTLNSSNPDFNPPKLRKQLTFPTLSIPHELSFKAIQKTQLNSLNKLNSSHAILKKDLNTNLPVDVQVMNSDVLSSLFEKGNPSKLLIIDIRPFNDFVKSHIKYATNVCLPSTLLKRKNFSLTKCINSLSDYERMTLTTFYNDYSQGGDYDTSGEPPIILLYDNYSTGYQTNNTLNLSNMCQKFLQEWANFKVYVLQGGFQEFVKEFETFTESGARTPDSKDTFNIDESNDNAGVTKKLPSMTPDTPQMNSAASSGNFFSPPSKPRLTPKSASFGNSPKFGNTPVLSRFVLPEAKTMFKIRHNEEQLTTNKQASGNPVDFKLFTDYRTLSSFEVGRLPTWIKKSSNQILDEFTNLELLEQTRLTKALSLNGGKDVADGPKTPNIFEMNQDVRSPPPTISCGIEYGYKNRYKDIFLYEHSRVKLRDFETKQSCDYINASYLSIPPYELKASTKYIATQGPLKETIGDFWKCVVNDKVPLIFSLTQETENGVTKCSPYWKSGHYRSNNNIITVKELESEVVMTNNNFETCKEIDQSNGNTIPSSTKSIIMRSFEVQIDAKIKHKVMQIHVLSWPDMDLIMNPRDLLSIIYLKKNILKSISSSSPVLVHCSAGCGRTGSLCAIDAVIDVINDMDMMLTDENLIFNTVNRFRKQRVSMVQTLRQYILVYDLILVFLRNKIYFDENQEIPKSCKWDSLENLQIVKNFINNVNGMVAQ